MLDLLLRPFRKRKRKATFREYGCEVRDFHLAEYSPVQYAQWLHPSESEKTLTEESIISLRPFINEVEDMMK